MNLAINILGGLLIGGGFLVMMWGVILVLKEAYKDGVLWLIGCMMIPIVLAFFVVKNPDRVRAARMIMLKGLIPLVLGLVLMVAFASYSGKAAAKPAEKAPPVAAAPPAPAPVAAPPVVSSAAASAAPAPAVKAAVVVTPSPVSGTPVRLEAPVIDHSASDAAILAHCVNEIGLYCASVKKRPQALKNCLLDYGDNLMAACKTAVRESDR